MKELTQKYRPARLDQVVGQQSAVGVIQKWIDEDSVPHAIMLHGPSGVGKTTIARILRKQLECSRYDFAELNCADARGIDTIREIRSRMSLAPIGKCRMWLLDESHKISSDGQTALLKLLEDPPPTVYFVLCTTEPGKMIRTIQTRCSMVAVRSLTPKQVASLLHSVAMEEQQTVAQDVIDRISEHSEGSARKALTMLHQVIGLPTEEEQLKAVERADHKTDSVHICRALMDPRTRWVDMARTLSECDLEEPEGIRHLVLAWCTKIMLGGQKGCARAAMVVDFFSDHFYDSKKAGLIRACYDVVSSNNGK